MESPTLCLRRASANGARLPLQLRVAAARLLWKHGSAVWLVKQSGRGRIANLANSLGRAGTRFTPVRLSMCDRMRD